MVAGLTFPYYSEARITFLPTYKYDIGTDVYDTSEKARIPAWCDRILRKGDNIRQINYDCAPLRFSDHRPVYATFQCLINKIDEKRKEQLSQELYGKRKEVVGDTRASSGAAMEDTDDEDLLGYESVEPGLPPASSDRRKWWLDSGLPARSRVQPPSADHFPNSKRPSNPFTPSPEPDWVEVRTTGRPEPPPARGTQRAHTVDFNNDGGTSAPTGIASSTTSLRPNPTARKLIAPPFSVNSASFDKASRGPLVAHLDGPNDLRRTPSAASTRSLPAIPHRTTQPTLAPSRTREVPRKKAPPIPTKKPSLHGAPTAPPLRYHDEPDSGASSESNPSRPLPPPPRRSMAERKPVGVGNGVGGLIDTSDERPALPPRTGTGLSARGRSLMDEEPEDMENLKGWEVLKPVR